MASRTTTNARIALFITTLSAEPLVEGGRTVGFCTHQRAGHIDVFTTTQHIGDTVVVVNTETGHRANFSRTEADAILLTAATNALLRHDRAIRAHAA